MVSAESPGAKKASAGDSSKYDIESVLPVLLAALDNPTINYKRMAKLDKVGRSEFAWQHRFRKWRATAKELIAADPDASNGVCDTPFKTPSKKATNSGRKAAKPQLNATLESGNTDVSEPEEAQLAKKRAATADADDESPIKKVKAGAGKKGTAKPKAATHGKPTNGGGAAIKTEGSVGDEDEMEMEFE